MPNPENLKGHGFDKKPENINRKGRPRKSFSSINNSLKDSGVEPLTKKQLIDSYSLIFNATEEELNTILKDKETPFLLKLIIKELNNTKTRARAIIDYRDYMFGKAEGGEQVKIVNVLQMNLDPPKDIPIITSEREMLKLHGEIDDVDHEDLTD